MWWNPNEAHERETIKHFREGTGIIIISTLPRGVAIEISLISRYYVFNETSMKQQWFISLGFH